MDHSNESVEDAVASTPPEKSVSFTKKWNLRKRKPREATPPEKVVEEDRVSTPVSAKKRKAPAKHESAPPKKKAKSVSRSPRANQQSHLFQVLLSSGTALQPVLSEWIKRYEADADKAMLELIQFFVECCGCKASISMEQYQESTTSDAIRSLTENFAEDSGEYPLIMSGPQYKKFKSNFVEFIERLIELCRYGIVYDEFMLDTVILWLVGFTDSQVRAFRHTCSLACMKLLTALTSVANNVFEELDNTLRQIDSERRRSESKRGTGKLEKLAAKKKELQDHIKSLHEMMNFIFSSVFVHRYRDVYSEIRATCIAELGVWLKNYYTHFLADSYLKYVGWTLFDKVGEVRLASLQALEGLYNAEELVVHMELFTQRFKSRVLSMRLDREEAVAVKAVQVCGHLLAQDVLEQEECVEVCELVFVESRAVSHAAGQFAVQYLFSEDFMTRARKSKVSKGHKKPTDSQIMLAELVRFFLEARIHQHTIYYVDSLWDFTDVLKDWEAMVSLLLHDKCGVVLTSEEEVAMVELLSCAVRRAASHAPPPGRSRGKAASAKEKKAMEREKEELTAVLGPALPKLISKYGTNNEMAQNLANIPQHFDLEIYFEHRLQKHLESLLSELHKLTMKHTDPMVLDECALTYKYICSDEFSMHSITEVAFEQLLDELVQNFRHYMEACRDELGEEESEDVFGLAASLKRLASLYKMINISSRKLSSELKLLLEAGVEKSCCDNILCHVVMCLKFDVLWMLTSVSESTPNRDRMRSIHTDLNQLVQHCHELVKFGTAAVQREAFVCLCDLLIVFGKQLHNAGQLGVMVFRADSLQQTLREYVLECVFGDSEDEMEEEPATDEEALGQAERLNDRRVLLAAFLKLAMFGAIEMKYSAPIFSQYIQQFHNYGDLIKMGITRCREANPFAWHQTILLSLQQVYEGLRSDDTGAVDHQAGEWADLKDLARKFSLTLGFDAVKVRKPVVGIHRDGIQYALAKVGDTLLNLDFLEVLAEFSWRLLEVDRTGKKGVLAYLQGLLPQEHKGEGGGHKGEEWRSLNMYRNSLVGQDGGGTGKRKAKPRHKQKDEAEGDTEGWLSAQAGTAARKEEVQGSGGEAEESKALASRKASVTEGSVEGMEGDHGDSTLDSSDSTPDTPANQDV